MKKMIGYGVLFLIALFAVIVNVTILVKAELDSSALTILFLIVFSLVAITSLYLFIVSLMREIHRKNSN